jgi:predicted nucleic acid-binding protein
MRKLRVFVDTSVFGGCFDDEFDKASRRFFEEVKAGRFHVVVSERIVMEVERAREEVKKVLFDLEDAVEFVDLTDEIAVLQNAYMDAGILGKSSLNDAEHIAVASVVQVDLLVSWNFKHIVHFDKIKAYNAVNALNGYREIDIRSPLEVVGYEKEI